MKGGRYDRLLHQFGKEAPAVGFCVVVDSILEALSRQKVDLPLPEAVKIVPYRPEDYQEKLAEVQELRRKGIAAALVNVANEASCHNEAFKGRLRRNGRNRLP